ncbi:5-formyltetrahydrofolate cyclo-ligase [Ornithinimicrobium sp. F0845]|uniref:5-formyltetrahydrofolate cyclo-ligase n=1 Tax=Ornithinimicrobium sp. F0845 TaxID=2926412 RepID=UPI001FF361B1|nr:5-formyltetrahydrofolate cyclo-ligase [Ornithinimicrobium sp. F0845]MCK0113923.1 5-formyltetrahydrofolate cyclo-ligase [Ornithinimicrobium sp. F0845]
MDGISAAKKQARAGVRARRREVVEGQGPAGRAEQADALATVFLTWLREYAGGLGRPGLSGLTITAFRALPGEPPVGALVQAALAEGARVLLPVTVRGEHDLHWVPAAETTGDGVAEDVMHGVALTGDELGPEALHGVDVALIPGLAVDSDGHRLGQGGGYYDRALPRLRPTVPVIVALHDHEVPTDRAGGHLPHAPHDILVDGVLTTAGVRLVR